MLRSKRDAEPVAAGMPTATYVKAGNQMVVVVPIVFDAAAIRVLARAALQWRLVVHEQRMPPVTDALFQHYILSVLLTDCSTEVRSLENIAYNCCGQQLRCCDRQFNEYVMQNRYCTTADLQLIETPELQQLGVSTVQDWLRQHVPLDLVTLAGSVPLLWYACLFELVPSDKFAWQPSRNEPQWDALLQQAIQPPYVATEEKESKSPAVGAAQSSVVRRRRLT